ncbi:MAG TPA: VWA domain-containing protein [Candidatus Acidoferrales bacterium]|nr:VWA domain-containing protein [Candidatus Acidoferrales bacterium]
MLGAKVTYSGVIHFCRFLRANGFSAGVTESVASVEAVRAVAAAVDPDALRWALRATLSSSKEEWDSFDRLFDAFWNETQEDWNAVHGDQSQIQRTPKTEPRGFWVMTGEPGSEIRPTDREAANIAGASDYARLKKVDFSEIPQSDQATLDRLAQRLLQQMSWRLSRRSKIAELRGRVDLRRTIRGNISRGGDPVKLCYKDRKPRPARVVILLDVSGSMSLYSMFLLRFAHALHRHCKRADTFIFSTRLVNIGGMLRARHLAEAMKAVQACPADWSGGTRIGGSLQEFCARHARLLSRDTAFIILSDGWDTGDPEVLARELGSIKSRVRKVIWLNPLLGLKDYRPLTRGMAAALPHVDVFAPAHSLESLLELERHLGW